MTTPITFAATSPRFALPLLFAAQAQKEVNVNEGLAIVDAMLHCAIEGIATTPPATPVSGTNWLVGTGGTGAWAGQDGQIAAYQQGNWVFIAPRDGVSVLNRANGKQMHYFGGWQTPAAPAAPSGGTTIDTQARATIAGLISALQTAGVM